MTKFTPHLAKDVEIMLADIGLADIYGLYAGLNSFCIRKTLCPLPPRRRRSASQSACREKQGLSCRF